MLKGDRWPFLMFAIMIVLGTLSIAIAAPRDEKTVLYMSFDLEPEEWLVEDESGYENHGSIIGSKTRWTEDGKFGGALEFDGATRIEIPHSASLNLDKGITVSIWFRTDVRQKDVAYIYKTHSVYLATDGTQVFIGVIKPNMSVSLRWL